MRIIFLFLSWLSYSYPLTLIVYLSYCNVGVIGVGGSMGHGRGTVGAAGEAKRGGRWIGGPSTRPAARGWCRVGNV